MEVANTINIQEPQIKRTSKNGQPLCNAVSVFNINKERHSTY